jgi:hypothetical protein
VPDNYILGGLGGVLVNDDGVLGAVTKGIAAAAAAAAAAS